MNNYLYPNYTNNIDRQIEELNKMKSQYQIMQPAPVQNIINTNSNASNIIETKFLKEGENINDIIIQNKTLFIDEKNKKIQLKELDGSISKSYEILIPKTKEEIKIEELENKNNELNNKLKEMELKINEYSKLNKSTNSIQQSYTIND